MPRRSRPVSLSQGDLELVSERLLEILPRAVVELEAPRTIGEVLAALGPTRREQLTRGAIALSGSADRSSREYRSARRRLERYVTQASERRGRSERGARRALEEVGRRILRPRLRTDQAVSVRLKADVIYVGQRKTMPAGEAQPIAPRLLGSVRERLREGDSEAAARALIEAFVLAYGLATDQARAGLDVIGNIEWIEVALA